MSIATGLTAIAQTKADIKAAIEAKGVDTTNTPFTDYDLKIAAISGGGGLTPSGTQTTITLGAADVIEGDLVASNGLNTYNNIKRDVVLNRGRKDGEGYSSSTAAFSATQLVAVSDTLALGFISGTIGTAGISLNGTTTTQLSSITLNSSTAYNISKLSSTTAAFIGSYNTSLTRLNVSGTTVYYSGITTLPTGYNYGHLTYIKDDYLFITYQSGGYMMGMVAYWNGSNFTLGTPIQIGAIYGSLGHRATMIDTNKMILFRRDVSPYNMYARTINLDLVNLTFSMNSEYLVLAYTGTGASSDIIASKLSNGNVGFFFRGYDSARTDVAGIVSISNDVITIENIKTNPIGTMTGLADSVPATRTYNWLDYCDAIYIMGRMSINVVEHRVYFNSDNSIYFDNELRLVATEASNENACSYHTLSNGVLLIATYEDDSPYYYWRLDTSKYYNRSFAITTEAGTDNETISAYKW